MDFWTFANNNPGTTLAIVAIISFWGFFAVDSVAARLAVIFGVGRVKKDKTPKDEKKP